MSFVSFSLAVIFIIRRIHSIDGHWKRFSAIFEPACFFFAEYLSAANLASNNHQTDNIDGSTLSRLAWFKTTQVMIIEKIRFGKKCSEERSGKA